MMQQLLSTFENLDPRTKDKLKLSPILLAAYYIHYQRHQALIRAMQANTFLDPALWHNDFPIVLVHGYCGCTMDENVFLGGYFHYAFSKVARELTDDESGKKKYLGQIYEADVSPIGSAHDRACELYQCLVGREHVERMARERGLTVTQAVYGVEHANEHHQAGQGYYKFKYLKSYDCETGKMLAYPSGLPGWDPESF